MYESLPLVTRVVLSKLSNISKPGWGFPGGSVVKESTCEAGDTGLIPESIRSLGGGNGNLLQYSCLENPVDRGAWWSTVQGVAKSQTGVKVKTKRCGRTDLLLRELGKNSYFCGWHKMTGKPFGKMFKKSLKMLFWPAMCHT